MALNIISRINFQKVVHGFRSYASNSNRKLNLTENYVQVLILDKSSPISSNILLAKWKEGNYEGRYTGIIQKYEDSISNANLKSFAESLVPFHSKTAPIVPKIQLHGILQFDGPPDCNEYIYLGIIPHISTTNILESQGIMSSVISENKNQAFDLEWFNMKSIPYEKMPADDAIWYEHVLQGKFITGQFIFGGLEQREIKSYSLNVVDDIESLVP